MFRQSMWLNSSSTDSSVAARLQDVLTDESTEDDIWTHNSSKQRIYTKTSYPSQEAKSSEMDVSSCNMNSASDNSSLV